MEHPSSFTFAPPPSDQPDRFFPFFLTPSLNTILNCFKANCQINIFVKIFFDWTALLPANVTKEGGAEIEDIAAGPQNTQLMTMLSQKILSRSGKHSTLWGAQTYPWMCYVINLVNLVILVILVNLVILLVTVSVMFDILEFPDF